jgi:hypothetical protein
MFNATNEETPISDQSPHSFGFKIREALPPFTQYASLVMYISVTRIYSLLLLLLSSSSSTTTSTQLYNSLLGLW